MGRQAFFSPKRGNRGSAVVEMTLLAPWVLFLFVGMVDLGFYTFDLIAVENAARVAAEYTSSSTAVRHDAAGACTRVRAELAMLPNVHALANCNAAPLTVTATDIAGPDTKPATSVTVTYQSARLVPIPGLLMGQLNVTRNVQMRVKP